MVCYIGQARDATTGSWNVYAAFTGTPGEFQSTFASSTCTTGSEKARHAACRQHCHCGCTCRGGGNKLCQLYSELEAVTIAGPQCTGCPVNLSHYSYSEDTYYRAGEGDANDVDTFQVANGKTCANEGTAAITDVAANTTTDSATDATANTNATAAYGDSDWLYHPAKEQLEKLYQSCRKGVNVGIPSLHLQQRETKKGGPAHSSPA